MLLKEPLLEAYALLGLVINQAGICLLRYYKVLGEGFLDKKTSEVCILVTKVGSCAFQAFGSTPLTCATSSPRG